MVNDRFWSKVARSSSGCWEWTANKNNKGYGLFRPGGVAPKVLAHRHAFEMSNGRIPAGMIVRHSCDNPKCVNPAHLILGTQRQNVEDAINRGRHRNPPNVHANPEWLAKKIAATRRGEQAPNSTLTEPMVREIWRLHIEGVNLAEISRSVGCSVHAAADVCRGRTWRHLPDAPSVEALQKGGVSRGYNQFSEGGDTRDKGTRTKIPSDQIPSILSRIASGETMASIGRSYGVGKAAISKIGKRYSL